MNLFAARGSRHEVTNALPDLRDRQRVAVDLETTSLNVRTTEIVGVAIATEDQEFYFPVGHPVGGNYALDRVVDWTRDLCLATEIIFHNAPFDLPILNRYDVAVPRCRDSRHPAALLSSKRQDLSLDALALRFLNRGKVKLPNDGLAIHERPAEVVAPYAATDARLTYDLFHKTLPLVEKTDQRRVLDLEDSLINVTIEMERNGALIDVDKLIEWRTVCIKRYQAAIMELRRLVSSVNSEAFSPTRRNHLIKLIERLKLRQFFDDEFGLEQLERFAHVPEIALCIDALRLDSLRSKYIDKYLNAVDDNNKIYYRLHQINADEGGTVSGRYSSSGGTERGINIQQVFKPEEQKGCISDMLVRELFIEEKKKLFVSADASQIEYRVFGHYANSDAITRVYQRDATADFHATLASWTDLTRQNAKHANFSVIFGAGLKKFAYMIDKTEEEARPIWNKYHATFPEAQRLLTRASNAAKSRGYVKTFIGRRRWFERENAKEKFHAALNSIVQGTAADINKLTLLKIYEHREPLGITMRFTVHDEFCGGIPKRSVAKFTKLINEQVLDLRVPILWNVKTGRSWSL